MNNSVLCNLAIIPPFEVAERATNLSQELHQQGGMFALDGAERFPHLTVYMARFAPENVIPALEVFERALANQQSFQLLSTGYFYTEGDYAEIEFAKSPELMDLQVRITGAAQPFRIQNDEPPYRNYSGPFSEEQRSNVRNTGYDLSGELYRPHISLTKFDKPHPEVVDALPPADYSFAAILLGWYYADEYGACTTLIRQFAVAS
jgi:hypothetical protein